MDPEIQRRRDDEHAPRLEDPEDLVERPPHLEDMLKRLDAKHGSGRSVRQADGRDVLDPVNARSRSHVAANERFAREEIAQVRVAFLPLDLERAELVHRGRTIERLGHEAAERPVVVPHSLCSSLSRRSRSRGPREALLIGRILEPTPETVNRNAASIERIDLVPKLPRVLSLALKRADLGCNAEA